MIVFETIRWRNVLSTGSQFTEIKLNGPHATLVVGENGAGKSTVLDALCFALFNKPFRNISKAQLVNSVNTNKALVEIEFTIGSKRYKVVRGIKPNVFEIYANGEILNQDAASRDYQKYLEDGILKLNFRSFTQIVILGSASFTPFMQLSTAHRREIIEDLLDIKIFSVMNDVLKAKQSDIKARLSDINGRLDVQKAKIDVQEGYIKTLEDDKSKRRVEITNEVAKTNKEIHNHTANISNVMVHVELLESSIDDATTQHAKKEKYKEVGRKLRDKIDRARKALEFYNDHSVCPTCNQSIGDDHKAHAVASHTSKLNEVGGAIEQVTGELNQIEARLSDIAETQDQINNHKSEIIKINNQIIAAQRYVVKIQEEINVDESDTGNIDIEKAKLKHMALEIVELVGDKSDINEDKYYLDVAATLLKDTGIKTKIINQYLPVINKLVNKYLAAMDFFVHFELDGAFNETIKSRHRDEFSYASFSEGEKQRIDLALLFAWRAIAKMKNSASTNLLMLDEVFDSSLDINGTDFVMALLNTISDDTNIFVISHRDALFDKFSNVIRFEKYQNHSRIKS